MSKKSRGSRSRHLRQSKKPEVIAARLEKEFILSQPAPPPLSIPMSWVVGDRLIAFEKSAVASGVIGADMRKATVTVVPYDRGRRLR